MSKDPLDNMTDPDQLRAEAKRYRARIGQAVSEAQQRAAAAQSKLDTMVATMAWVRESLGEREWYHMSEAAVATMVDLKLQLDGAHSYVEELTRKIEDHRAKCPMTHDPV